MNFYRRRAQQWYKIKTRQAVAVGEIVRVGGSVYKSNGYVYVRGIGGDVSNGDEIVNTPVPLRQRAGVNMVIKSGRVVQLAYGYDGKLEIVGNDTDDLINAGIPIRSLNLGDDQSGQTTIELINNLKAFSNAPADTSVQVVPSIYKKADGNYAIAPQSFDVGSLIGEAPAGVNDQVVVCVWLNTTTNTYTITTSSALSQNTDLRTNPTTAMTYVNECAALAPANHIGVWSYIVRGDDTTITEANRLHDLRGILSESGNGTGALTTTRYEPVMFNGEILVLNNDMLSLGVA